LRDQGKLGPTILFLKRQEGRAEEGLKISTPSWSTSEKGGGPALLRTNVGKKKEKF